MKFISDFISAKLAKIFPNPAVRKKKIFIFVAGVHILIPIILLCGLLIASLFPKKIITSIPVQIIVEKALPKTKVIKSAQIKKTVKKRVVKKKSRKKTPVKKKITKTKPTPPRKNSTTNRTKTSTKYQKELDRIMKVREQTYYEGVSSWLYQIWNQPNKPELKGQKPYVEVQFKIDANGKILKKSIIKKSANAVMNRSIEQLLTSLSKLPKPPDGSKTFTVILEIVD